LAGYTAVCANSRSEAQLARLAVHPTYQGRGVGRALLADTIVYAAQEFDRLVLNTQTTNHRSQKLYAGFGFRPIGLSVPVLAQLLQ
jgi:ribosomal protein S18 acetylase RimI-like enzyme